MARHFTAEIRVLLCEGCGAPLQAPLEGGAMPCTYCRAHNVVTSRDERPTLGMSAVPAPVDEGVRMARLRQQDGRPLVPPASITYLFSGSSFEPSKIQEAFLIYQATRKEVRTTSSPDAAERLYFLTLVGNNYFTEQSDPDRRRGMLETSLDTLFLPRHKQVIRGLLSSAAAKERDMQAAERWLAPCDTRSDDLESDSAYRNARAYIDTIKSDYRAVIAILGSTDDEVPIMDARDPVCAVLRANALEKLGNVEAAVACLKARMSKESASGRMVIEEYVAKNPELTLCPASLPAALSAHTQRAVGAAAASAGGGIGPIFFYLGIALLILTIVLMIGGAAPGVLALFMTGVHDPATVLAEIGGAIGGAVLMGLGTGICGVIFVLVGGAMRNAAKKAAYLREHGVRARGVIQSLSATGTEINGVPMMEMIISVRPTDAAPYEAKVRHLMQPAMMMQLGPGREVPLRVHPTDPQQVLLELT